MPRESRFFIKTGLVWLVAALLLGGLQRAAFLGFEAGPVAVDGPAHVHLFVFGWVTQVIVGVALWMFPPPSRERPRGRRWLSWVAYAGINVGLALRVVAEPMVVVGTVTPPWNSLLLAAAVAQAGGCLAFVVNIWPRVKGR